MFGVYIELFVKNNIKCWAQDPLLINIITTNVVLNFLKIKNYYIWC